MREIKAPQFVSNKVATIFLAGSIEMGTAENWQDRAVKLFKDSSWTILNPRRDDWDSSWVQDILHPQFFEQVSWELQGIEEAEWVIIYFDPNTKAPITLLELGICSQLKPEHTIVVCPEGFYRKGNVDVVIDRFQMKEAATLENAVKMFH